MTVFDQILFARDAVRDTGIVPNAVRLGAVQWQEVRRSLANSDWPEALDMSPTRMNIHGLWVHLALYSPDLLDVYVHLEVRAK